MANKRPIQMIPSALPKRAVAKTNRYTRRSNFVSSLDSVEVDVRTTSAGSEYSAPELPGETFDRMRNYGTVLAHWSLEDRARYAKRWSTDMSNVNAACRVVANSIYQQVFAEDPTIDTVNIKPYIDSLNDPKHVTPAVVQAALSFYGTQAFDQIVAGVKDVGIKNDLTSAAEHLKWHLKYYLEHVRGLHSDAKSRSRKRAIAFYKDLVHEVKQQTRNVMSQHQQRQEDKANAKKKAGHKPSVGAASKPIGSLVEVAKNVREIFTDASGWQRAFVHKPVLEVPHTGLMGRRRISSNEGKYPKYFSRMVTDPQKRIFARKTRALGGVVVIDCSGSMHLDESDVRQLLHSSAGCTVVCYSASNDPSEDSKHGNIHLVARNGRMVRHLPDFPGGNGVDVPALQFALTYRRSGNPMVWVSDERVTGINDTRTHDLVAQKDRFIARHNVLVVPNVREAVKLLKRLQQGRNR
jgi:hypothetical protein